VAKRKSGKKHKKSGKKKRKTSAKQKAAARRNIKKAQKASRAAARAESKPKKRRHKKRKAHARKKSHKRKKGHKRGRKRAGGHSRSRSTHRSSSRVVHTEKTRVITVPKKGTQAIQVHLRGSTGGKRKKGRRKKRRHNPAEISDLSLRHTNPGEQGIFSNAGPFSGEGVKKYGIAIGGVGVGLIVADVLDRFVATRTPASASNGSAQVKGQRPWYGKDAAAAIRRRPDAWRLGAQAALAVGAVALGYFTRNKPLLSWFFGGLSVGAGSALFEKLWTWYAGPMLMSVDKTKPSEMTIGNRLYSFEQGFVQDDIDKAFETWPTIPQLMSAQAPGDNPTIAPVSSGALQGLPSGKAHSGASGTTGSPRHFVNTGRLGKCGGCGGSRGCWSDCSGYKECPDCDQAGRKCKYMIQPGDDLAAMAGAAGVNMETIAALNGGTIPSVGSSVILPESMCGPIFSKLTASGGDGAPDTRGTRIRPPEVPPVYGQHAPQTAVDGSIPGAVVPLPTFSANPPPAVPVPCPGPVSQAAANFASVSIPSFSGVRGTPSNGEMGPEQKVHSLFNFDD